MCYWHLHSLSICSGLTPLKFTFSPVFYSLQGREGFLSPNPDTFVLNGFLIKLFFFAWLIFRSRRPENLCVMKVLERLVLQWTQVWGHLLQKSPSAFRSQAQWTHLPDSPILNPQIPIWPWKTVWFSHRTLPTMAFPSAFSANRRPQLKPMPSLRYVGPFFDQKQGSSLTQYDQQWQKRERNATKRNLGPWREAVRQQGSALYTRNSQSSTGIYAIEDSGLSSHLKHTCAFC